MHPVVLDDSLRKCLCSSGFKWQVIEESCSAKIEVTNQPLNTCNEHKKTNEGPKSFAKTVIENENTTVKKLFILSGKKLGMKWT